MLTWRMQLDRQPRLLDFTHWQIVDTSKLSKNNKRIFHRNIRVIQKVLSGLSLSDAAKSEHLSVSMVNSILNRCLQSEIDEEPFLTSGCLPYFRVSRTKRRKHLSSIKDKHPGHHGEFWLLLHEQPIIKEALEMFIKNKLKDKKTAHTITPQSLHSEFKRVLIAIKWPQDVYPYNTNSVAYHSVNRFLKSYLKRHFLTEISLSKAERFDLNDVLSEPLRVVEIDEQLIDTFVSIDVEFCGQVVSIRLPRITIIVAVDKDSSCILAFHLCLTRHVSKEDMLHLIKKLTTGQPNIEITTPGFEVFNEVGFPKLVSPSGSLFGIKCIKLDNALAHLANDVRDVITCKLGSTLSFSKKKSPLARNSVEFAMQYVNSVTHRFASTTGSNPLDDKKESNKNKKEPPVLSVRTLEEALYLTFSDTNSKRKGSLALYTPIQYFNSAIENSYPRIISKSALAEVQHFTNFKYVMVHFHKHENRKPYVNYLGLRYSGNSLLDATLLDTKIKIEIDLLDARYIKAYDKQERFIGVLSVPKSWLRFKHTYHLRRVIFKLLRQQAFSSQDPLIGYFNFIKSKIHLPKYALRLAKIIDAASFYAPVDEETTSLNISSDGKSSSLNKMSSENSISEKRVKNESPIKSWNTLKRVEHGSN